MKFWIILGIMFALFTAQAQVEGAALKRSPSCKIYPHPKNGVLTCNSIAGEPVCRVQCNKGFHFERRPPFLYYCQNGEWQFYDLPGAPAADFAVPWPDCIKTTPSPSPPY
ncbi:uncharacterized protein LOC110062022 [Orbicella faveolata]|uniref:uncharacterized protein LOC110062022 n=1 Tax=Orbicella faveolata TaxID=48498 RepID=UPI0009E64DF8|nr:uncharacterized protein LOC110062022 [Orbicella faveolata]